MSNTENTNQFNKMKIGLIDADLIGQKQHNFPNLALMKISGYFKNNGYETELIHYDEINPNCLFQKYFDKVFISKVFTNTKIPENILKLDFVEFGGTGFFYDKSPNLPDEIEHHFPDYNLYNNWIKEKIRKGKKEDYFKYYTDFSIGFTTRGCFRQCEFCVNRNEKKVYPHSPLSEFIDKNRKKICLLDDNILGCGKYWEQIFKELQATKKPFQYKQGMDIRILSEKKAKILAESKYEGDYIFAFDNIKDKNLIEKKLQLFKKYMPTTVPKLYVFCAFDRNNIWNDQFWYNDLIDIFERLKLLMQYKSLPYLMRFEKWDKNNFKFIYTLLSSWCNCPAIFKKMSFRQHCGNNKYIIRFEKQYPEIALKYFDMKFGEIY